MQKSKMAVLGGLINSCENKGSEKQRRKGKIYPFEAEFQRIARRDKKAFLSDQCKEREENNRMGKWGTSGVSPGESVHVSSGGMHVRFPPELLQQSRIPSPGSRDLWLSLEAFPIGFPTTFSHRDVPRATVV